MSSNTSLTCTPTDATTRSANAAPLWTTRAILPPVRKRLGGGASELEGYIADFSGPTLIRVRDFIDNFHATTLAGLHTHLPSKQIIWTSLDARGGCMGFNEGISKENVRATITTSGVGGMLVQRVLFPKLTI